MPVTKEQFLARMAAGRAKKAAERAAATPAAAAPASVSAPKPKTKSVTAAPVTTVKPTMLIIDNKNLKSPKILKSQAAKNSEAPLA
jgi:hypothetical protein